MQKCRPELYALVFFILGPGLMCRLEMLTEEGWSKAMATEGVSTLPKEPEFARKKFSVGADTVMHGVVGGLNGLSTGLGLRDPRVQMRENKMVVRQLIMGLYRAVEMRKAMQIP